MAWHATTLDRRLPEIWADMAGWAIVFVTETLPEHSRTGNTHWTLFSSAAAICSTKNT